MVTPIFASSVAVAASSSSSAALRRAALVSRRSRAILWTDGGIIAPSSLAIAGIRFRGDGSGAELAGGGTVRHPKWGCGRAGCSPPLSRSGGVGRRSMSTTSVLGVRGGGDGESDDIILPARPFRRAFIAVGANLGDRYGNVASALRLLESRGNGDGSNGDGDANGEVVRVLRTSYLRETAPMYVTDQPPFLNGMVEVDSTLSPRDLLRRIKEVEVEVGRDLNGLRYGPRPVDLDIIMYGVGGFDGDNDDDGVMDSDVLTIPHPRMAERDFVLSPLCDIDRDVVHPVLNKTAEEMRDELSSTTSSSSEAPDAAASAPVRVLPLPRGRMLRLNETVVMGILNVTPDSFSDGGRLGGSVQRAVEEALQMERDGAGIIDIGGESTRPGAKEVEVEEELSRTIPVIKGIRNASDVPISIDTRHAAVARAAVEAGADVVNDVSGGTHDPDMLRTVADLAAPVVLMHMRGTPETMQSLTDYGDDGVVAKVAAELREASEAAERAGVARWMQVLDPGIGFAKDLDGNLSLLRHALSRRMRELVGGDFPLLLGPSRKGFIGKVTGETRPEERDFGSAAACVAAVAAGCGTSEGGTILRVHNVRGVKQAALVMDAILAAN